MSENSSETYLQPALVPLETLLYLPRNAKDHDIGGMGTSVERWGFVERIVVNRRTGHILGGNGRTELLRQQKAAGKNPPPGIQVQDGSWYVPIDYVNIPEEEEEPLALALNRWTELGGYKEDVLVTVLQDLAAKSVTRGRDMLKGTGYTQEDVDEKLAMLAGGQGQQAEIDPEADNIPEEVPTRTQAGDLWALGEHKLLCGDSTNAEDVARVLKGEVPLIMVTDPPYGVEYDPGWRNEAAEKGLISFAARREGRVANDDRVNWSEAWALFPGNVVYCWHAGRYASEVANDLSSCEFIIRNQIIWAKPRFVISRGHYNWQHEPCWYAVRKGKTAGWIGDHSQTTLWNIAQTTDGQKTEHGTQKPVECMARAIRNHSGNVYEPFAGSGTTIIACEELGRGCFAIEIEPRYCDIILTRWEQLTGRQAELLERITPDGD